MRLPRLVRVPTHLESRAHHLAFFIVLAAALAGGATIGVAWAAGFEDVLDRLQDVRWPWLAAAVAGQVVAYGGYVLAYREVARVEDGPELDPGNLAAVVTTGFGVFIPRGGFAVDVQAFEEAGVDPRAARVRVLGLGALEYAVLGPAACASAIFLLLTHRGRPHLGLTLPWAIAVPVGFAVALWAIRHRERFRGRRGWREHLGRALDGVDVLRCLAARPLTHGLAPLGMGVYWLGDIFTLWASLHAFVGDAPSIPALILGYATGYALTRRTLPLAGAGVVEALLPFALGWVGIALAPAVLAVFAYRVFNLWLPLVPAAIGLQKLRQRSARERPVRPTRLERQASDR